MDIFVDLSGGKIQLQLLDDIVKIIKETNEWFMDTDNDFFELRVYDENVVKKIKILLNKYKNK